MKRIISTFLTLTLLIGLVAPAQANISPVSECSSYYFTSDRDHRLYSIFDIFDEVAKYSQQPVLFSIQKNSLYTINLDYSIFYGCFVVTVNTGFLEQCRTKEEVLMGLFHEIGHINMNHIFYEASHSQEFYYRQELCADAWAIATLMANGYSPKGAIICLTRLSTKNGPYHPGVWKRIESINKMIQTMNKVLEK